MPASDLQAFNFTTLQGASGKPKLVGSRGSMVAKLKLKGIDGRAPPGVNALAPKSTPEKGCASLESGCVVQPPRATPSNCLKVLLGHRYRPGNESFLWHHGECRGYGNNPHG